MHLTVLSENALVLLEIVSILYALPYSLILWHPLWLTNNEIVPDSGSTSHMRKNGPIFEDYYVTCNDVVVLMVDGTKIPVLGYGTFQMKIDGHVTRLIKSLHVPGLDSDLFSCTPHGMIGKGVLLF